MKYFFVCQVSNSFALTKSNRVDFGTTIRISKTVYGKYGPDFPRNFADFIVQLGLLANVPDRVVGSRKFKC